MSQSITLDDASNPLLSRRLISPQSFPQQGVWSWVDLGKTVVNISTNLLRRYSAADIDIYTLLAGQYVAGSFKFGKEGRKRFEQAILTLPSMQSMGNIIHFGFGIDSIIRSLATTEEGGCLVVLCAAAAECFPENHSANIMYEMVRSYQAPDSFMPSALQWKALIRVCAGSLAICSFPKMADHFMGLIKREEDFNFSLHSDRGCSSPESLAQALLGIGKVSTGKLESIKIIGPSDIGWLAAIAEWMLDLRISVSTSRGTLLHKNCQDIRLAQIHFFISKQNEADRSTDVEIQTTVYHLRDFTDVLYTREGSIRRPSVCGRVPWSTALSGTFGSYFERCSEGMPSAFGQALGCAARMFEAVKNAEEGFSGSLAVNCASYFSSSYGKGFVNFACHQFPELKALRQEMDEGASKSAKDALAAYEACLVNIGSVCQCSICKGKAKDIGRHQSEKLCLVCILETIIVATRSLSGISVAENLNPLLTGLESFYQQQLEYHFECIKTPKAWPKHLDKVKFLFERSSGQDGVSTGQGLLIRRLADGARMFCRGKLETPNYNQHCVASAITVGGITIFLDALLDISDHPERLGLCHIIPGQINAHDRNFTYVEDLSDFNAEGRYHYARDMSSLLENYRRPLDLDDNYTNASLFASESVNTLQVGYQTTGSGLPKLMLGVAQYTSKNLQAFGLVKCSCPEKNESQLEIAASTAITQLEGRGLTTFWHFKGNMISSIIAAVMCELFECDNMFMAIIRTEECLSCCKDAAQRSQYKDTLIISRNHFSIGTL